MNWNNVITLLPFVGSVVGGTATIVAGIVWLMKRHAKRLSKAEARIKRLEMERDGAVRQKNAAEKERDQARLARDNALAKAEQALQTAWHNYHAGERVKAMRERAVARIAELEASEAAERRRTNELATEVEQLTALNKEQRESLERYEAQIDAVAKQDGRVWCSRPVVKPPEFVPLANRLEQRPTIISVLNLKGGVGKTTLTANLGGYLAHHLEKWVLLLDLDHQRSLTQTVFTTRKRKDIASARRTIQDFLISGSIDKNLLQFAEQVEGDGLSRLWVVGTSDAAEGYGNTQNLDDLEMDLLGQWLLHPAAGDIRYLLRSAIHSAAILERYDYVLIDCPPRLTTGCINALAASDYVLIPAQAEHVSASSVSHLLRRLRPLRDCGVLPDLRVLGVVGNMVSAAAEEPKSRESKLLGQTTATAAALWGSLVRLFRSMIRDSGHYAKYQRDSEEKDCTQLPSVAVNMIREQYENLAREIEECVNAHCGTARVPS